MTLHESFMSTKPYTIHVPHKHSQTPTAHIFISLQSFIWYHWVKQTKRVAKCCIMISFNYEHRIQINLSFFSHCNVNKDHLSLLNIWWAPISPPSTLKERHSSSEVRLCQGTNCAYSPQYSFGLRRAEVRKEQLAKKADRLGKAAYSIRC